MAAALFRLFDLGRSMDQPAKDAPLLGVFTTQGDSHEDWVASGRALAAVLHGMAMNGLVSAFLNQTIEVETTRRALSHLVGSSETPQLLSSFGYVKQGVALPRTEQRPLDEMLIAV